MLLKLVLEGIAKGVFSLYKNFNLTIYVKENEVFLWYILSICQDPILSMKEKSCRKTLSFTLCKYADDKMHA